MDDTAKRNLHLLWDEKITPGIIDNFENALPGENDYIFWWDYNASLHFAKEEGRCYIIHKDGKIPDLSYNHYSKIIIHALDYEKAMFCMKHIPPHIPVFWIMWGYDLYNSFLEPRGYKIYHSFSPKKTVSTRIKSIFKKMGFLSSRTKRYLSFFKDRDITMVCSQEEYNLLRKYYPKQTRTLKNNPNFFYYPVEKILGDLSDSQAFGNKILVGNSNSYTNNHFYVYKFLKRTDLTGKKLVLPLNYGGREETRKMIVKEGEKIFGDKIIPLTEFLKLDDYNKLMMECEYAVYGNWRQEAMGNILVALYLGSKVFLSKRNPLLKMFRDMGIKIFILEEIERDSFQKPLKNSEKERNREIIKSHYNMSLMNQNIIDIFS